MSKKKGSHAPKKKSSEEPTTTKKSKTTAGTPESTKLSIWSIIIVVAAVVVGFLLSNGHIEPPPEVASLQKAHEQTDRVKSNPVVNIVSHGSVYSDAATINKKHGGKEKAKLSEVFEMACVTTKLAICKLEDLMFDDERRTVWAKRKISKNTHLISVPPELQISSLMAIRDPRMKRFLDAKPILRMTKDKPTGDCYLGLYIMMERKRLSTKPGNPEDWNPTDRLFKVYFDYLPTYEDFLMFHPGVQKMMELKDDIFNGVEPETIFPPFNPFMDQTAVSFSLNIIYDYMTFSELVEDFGTLWSFEEFAWAQWIVVTRSYGKIKFNIPESEVEELLPHLFENDRNQLGVTMMMLIDAFNDNQNSNIQWWNYQSRRSDNPDSLGSSVYNSEEIEAGSELLITYGKDMLDYQKFGQYGYANADGSEKVIASLSPYHGFVYAEDEGDNYADISRKYLDFGDGYEECPVPHVEENEKVKRRNNYLFQYARFKALHNIFHDTQYWFVMMPTEKGENVEIDEFILTMCRIMAMNHRDYNSLATKVLANFASPNMLRSSGDESLDYRTYHVLERLSTQTLSELRAILSRMIEYGSDDGEKRPIEVEAKIRLDSNKLDRMSLEGMKIYILVREVESLQTIIALAQDKKKYYLANKQKKLENGEVVNEEDYTVRMTPCSLE